MLTIRDEVVVIVIVIVVVVVVVVVVIIVIVVVAVMIVYHYYFHTQYIAMTVCIAYLQAHRSCLYQKMSYCRFHDDFVYITTVYV